jgi:hypothetical protein
VLLDSRSKSIDLIIAFFAWYTNTKGSCTAPENGEVDVQDDFLKHSRTLREGQYMALQLGNTQPVKTRTRSVVGSLDPDIVAVQLRFPPTTSEILPEESGFAVCATKFGGMTVLGLYFIRTVCIVGSYVYEDNKHYSLFLER